MTPRLKVQNFGPIKTGYTDDDGFIPFGRMTAFCGAQGVGKSSVAKLFSTFAYLEKALMRGDVTEKYITQYNRFVNNYCAYHRIDGFFRDDTLLQYEGEAYRMVYSGRHLTVTPLGAADYVRPKILYIPAERNMLSVVSRIAKVKGIPPSLAEMLEDYLLACRSLKGTLDLPINGVHFSYDALNGLASIVGNDYVVRLESSASGIQAFTPMYVVANHFYSTISRGEDVGMNATDAAERKKIAARVEALLKDETLDDAARRILIKNIVDTANKRIVCIVEEPEQNLFPTTQRTTLNCLLSQTSLPGSRLMLTTHSPYIINYLSLAIKAHSLSRRTDDSALLARIAAVVPAEAWVSGDDVRVYEIDDDGSIRKLRTCEGMPSDSNYLNARLGECNDLFDQLLAVEDEL